MRSTEPLRPTWTGLRRGARARSPADPGVVLLVAVGLRVPGFHGLVEQAAVSRGLEHSAPGEAGTEALGRRADAGEVLERSDESVRRVPVAVRVRGGIDDV